uniref:Putative gene transfer agent protein n=1 Tax=Rhodobacter capsulatus TaxID=1061 RepID=A6PVB4_RHOCA|nr:putative gene transfer agent protein [Rhodobacter capsulatus]
MVARGALGRSLPQAAGAGASALGQRLADGTGLARSGRAGGAPGPRRDRRSCRGDRGGADLARAGALQCR